ncbi:MAG: M1 family aminopeptidase [Acidimicrobiales bacterium]
MNAHRLNRDVIPSAYRLSLGTDIGAGTFSGTVTVTAEVAVATAEIVCNAVGLTVHEATVTAGDRVLTATTRLDEATERLFLDVGEELAPGPITIDLSFDGELGSQLVGFYASNFTVDDEPHQMAVTQFEAPYARRAFPCWDEPEFKATFTISLTCDTGLTAVSNGPEIARTEVDAGPDGTTRTRFDFAETMPMSTYLVAWVIGELETSETVRGGSTDIRVIHRPGQGHLTSFALECAAHAVGWFEEYYGIAYPGAKLDLVAVPDFAFGAMENLGCVTFRENLLLIDPERSNRSEQERAATVIEHEIAHMWFGDLVTMQWWNGIWLNEAFATFMEFCCADDFRPEWEIWTSFGLSKSQAFETDALAHTRPIEFEVVTPADAEAMFDILTYEKGASVLRMFERWAGADAFREGVRRYLSRHAYGNTDTPDLWSALAEATGADVSAMMNTWILQGGHPLVSVRAEGSTLVLDQCRFEFAGGDPVEPATWLVPVRLMGVAGGTPFERTLMLSEASTTVELDGAVDWVDVNAGFTGFYRSQYSPELRAALHAVVGDLSSLDRYALVDDAWALLLAGRIELEELADTLRAVASVEAEPSVWRRIAGVVAGVASFATDADRDALAEFVTGLIGERLLPGDRVAPDSTSVDRDLRSVLFRLGGTIGRIAWVIDEARTLFAGLPESISGDPELSAAVLDVVAANGTEADFEALLAMFRDASTPQEELRALSALAQFPDESLTLRLCEMCATEVRTQNAPFTLAQAMGNPQGGAATWRFVSSRWDELVARFPSSTIIRMASGVRAFSEPGTAADVLAFFADHPVPQATLTLEQILERVRVNVATRGRLGDDSTGGIRNHLR